ncbi:MAG: 2-C-methyl-D-erythritol 4-phosphate cytidylyltransferase [Spirochaetales bacterium]|nr:2-C-methyl-D-erythritol 4-phosphate cytidylyltransferase [Spirochaetales bacterium]
MDAAVLVAAGRSARFGGLKKEYRPLGPGIVLDASLRALLSLPSVGKIALALPPGGLEEARGWLDPALAAEEGGRLVLVEGGAERADSVRLALEALEPWSPSTVLVHDAARPWATRELCLAVLELAAEKGAALPVVPPVDTIKRVDAEGRVLEHPSRATLGAAQTPQGFRFAPLLAAHRRAAAEGTLSTDDSELWARYEGPVFTVTGERANRKITFPEDLLP